MVHNVHKIEANSRDVAVELSETSVVLTGLLL